MPLNLPAEPKHRYPRLLIFAFLALSLAGWLRLQQAIYNWQWLADLGAQPGALYVALGGAVWGAMALLAAALLWIGYPWAGWVGRAAALGLALLYWADRLLFNQSPAGQANWLFMLALTIFCLLYVYAATAPEVSGGKM